MSWLDEYAAEAVRAAPDPPRHTPLRRIVARSYRSRSARWLTGFGLALGIPSAIFWAVVPVVDGQEQLRLIFVVLSIVFVAVFAGAPMIGAVRLWTALRHGIVVDGEVLTATWSPPALRPATIDAGVHGLTEGRRRVFHPAGSFVEPFESDSWWARDLAPGARVRLLADAGAAKVRFDLGLHHLGEPTR